MEIRGRGNINPHRMNAVTGSMFLSLSLHSSSNPSSFSLSLNPRMTGSYNFGHIK
jgi:hypothetical protein